MSAWWSEFVAALKQPEVAGSVGAVLGSLNAPGDTLRAKFFNLLAGVACAMYIAPLVAELTNVTSERGRLAFVFVCGLVGMNLLAKFISYVSESSLGSLFAALRGAPGKPRND